MKSSGCISVFGVLVFLFAAGIGAVALSNVHGPAIGLSLFLALVLIFAAAGIGLVWLGWKMRVEGRNQAVRRERYPDQPWRWREDWEQGFARSDGRGTARVQL